MNWLVAHIYVVAVTLAGFALIAGGVVISERASRPAENTNATWGRAGGFAFTGSQDGASIEDSRPQIEIPGSQQSAPDYRPISLQTSIENSYSRQKSLPLEWESLLNQLSQPVSGGHGEPETTSAYSFIPRGLISTTTATVKQRTPSQEELFEYGNRAGLLIRDFDDTHRTMIPTLKDAYADRTNTEKRMAAEKIGEDYEKLGKELQEMTEVPASIASMHLALARAYQDAGKKMVTKLRAPSDEEFLAAIHAYNASALEFINRFVAFASYLSAAGVQFSTTDPGSVFTFQAVSQ